ncbi:MAG: hypothetical protein V4710_06420, partial [Verrucomicrobiota bacterium]
KNRIKQRKKKRRARKCLMPLRARHSCKLANKTGFERRQRWGLTPAHALQENGRKARQRKQSGGRLRHGKRSGGLCTMGEGGNNNSNQG